MPDSTMMEQMFPGNGLDVSCELGRQPPLTTPEAVNVRTFEPGTNRGRGGSREGLTRFLDDPHSGNHEIQHLAMLVTTSPVNLAAGVTPPFDLDLFLLDPSSGSRNPGRMVPIGGSGVSQNRNVSNLPPNPDDPPGNLIPGSVVTAGTTYTVGILPFGTRTVQNLGPNPVPEGSPTIVVRIDGIYYMQGGA